MWPAIALMTFVTLQRLSELLLANANTRRLLEMGAREYGREHYPLIIALHGAWLGALWWLAPGRAIHWPFLILFALLQFGRLWVIRTLGPRWTTRIIVLPGAPLITGGPFRFVSHPNYLVVIGEIAVLPLVFGLWPLAVLFSVLNAAVLAVRVREENRALAALAPPGP